MYKVLLLDEAERFMFDLTPKARLKIVRTLDLVEGGCMDAKL